MKKLLSMIALGQLQIAPAHADSGIVVIGNTAAPSLTKDPVADLSFTPFEFVIDVPATAYSHPA
jgi:hypothetical protein